MARKYIKTNHTGLRYFEHQERKHGKKKDRYYLIRFRTDGTLYSYGIGWLSEGIPDEIRKAEPDLGFEDYCLKLLREYKGNVKIGSGAKSPQEKRMIAAAKIIQEQEELEREQERLEQEGITFKEIFTNKYFPIQKQNKVKGAWSTEASFFKLWIEPTIGSLPLKDISPIHLERIKKIMADAKKTPRTAAYALSIIRQVYNFTNRAKIYAGKWPGADKAVKIPKKDNRRQRYLTHEEAEILLAKVKAISPDTHDMALLSLHCGLRAGEVFSLTWADIDLTKGTIFIRDPKNKRNRHAYITAAVKTMLEERVQGKRSDSIFNRRADKTRQDKDEPLASKVDRISKTFKRVVAAMDLNKDITDTRQKVVFHSLRHTYASWLVESGVSLYTVQKLLGHENISQTERYSHLSPDNLQGAVRTLEAGIIAAKRKQDEKNGQVVNFTK